MHYSFEYHSALYVIAALAVFGLPMTCIFLAACRVIRDGSHSPKQGGSLRSSQPSVTIIPPAVKQSVTPRSKQPKVRTARRLEIAWRYTSIPVPVRPDRPTNQ